MESSCHFSNHVPGVLSAEKCYLTVFVRLKKHLIVHNIIIISFRSNTKINTIKNQNNTFWNFQKRRKTLYIAVNIMLTNAELSLFNILVYQNRQTYSNKFGLCVRPHFLYFMSYKIFLKKLRLVVGKKRRKKKCKMFHLTLSFQSVLYVSTEYFKVKMRIVKRQVIFQS